MQLPHHSLNVPGVEDPGQIVAGAKEVAEEGEVGHQMNNKEKPEKLLKE